MTEEQYLKAEDIFPLMKKLQDFCDRYDAAPDSIRKEDIRAAAISEFLSGEEAIRVYNFALSLTTQQKERIEQEFKEI